MILSLLRGARTRRRAIEALHGCIDAGARSPGLYRTLGVPDTVEGRFEALCLHVILVLRRLRALPPPAADVAQDLVNAVFAQLDASLRELGVGDVGVPKRMKKLAMAFYGRLETYGAALDAGDRPALAAALARNALSTSEAGEATALAEYALAAEALLAQASLDELLTSGPRFPDPDAIDAGERRSA